MHNYFKEFANTIEISELNRTFGKNTAIFLETCNKIVTCHLNGSKVGREMQVWSLVKTFFIAFPFTSTRKDF